jgi:hypothetical protein
LIVYPVISVGEILLKTVKYNYSAAPTRVSSNLGFIHNYTSVVTTVAIYSFTNSAAFSLPIGVYICDAYCIFTPGSSAAHILKLGINTSSGALSGFNYTLENTLTASNLPHSIRFSHYLTVSTQANYFFVFNTNLAGNLNGTLNGKFIRIG